MWILRESIVDKSQLNRLVYLSNTRNVKKIKRPKKWVGSPEWVAYKKQVLRLTSKQPIHLLENYDLRAWNGHHLDHKISIWYGYIHNLPVEKIADISNLRFIFCSENLKKGVGCVFEDLRKPIN